MVKNNLNCIWRKVADKAILAVPLLLMVWATPSVSAPDDDYTTISEAAIAESTPAAVEATTALPEKKRTKAQAVSEAELLANPALLQRAMESTLFNKNIAQIRVVLPIYEKMPQADKVLINYGKALINHDDGNYKSAIDGYRAVLAEQPQLSAVRFYLAMALYRDKQTDAALAQFEKLQSEDLPESIAKPVAAGIEAINAQTDWQFNFNAYYQVDDNINDAPSQSQIPYGSGTLTFPQAEKAHGIHLDMGASKRFNLPRHLYSTLRFQLNSDYYWDNHDYDDLTLRAGTGLGYQNAKLTAELEPFVKKRYFGGEAYSYNVGAKTVLSYRITPKLRLTNVSEFSEEHFDARKHLNGARKFTSLSATYTTNPRQYFAAGFNFFDSDARDADDSYRVKGFFLGWGQEWYKGISSKLTLSTSKREHKGVDFFNIQREDRKYSANLALWHRNIHYWGLTPRLVFAWEKTNSNHFYYDDQKESSVRLEVSKQF